MWTYNYQRPNELYHHGVKGMKWGVRHDRPSKGNTHTSSNSSTKRGLSKKQKIAIGVAAVGGMAVIMGAVYLHKKNTYLPSGITTIKTTPLKDSLDMFSSKNGVDLRKGIKLQRISSEAAEHLVKNGSSYVSYKFKDNMKYIRRLPNESWLSGKDVYVHKIRTTKPVKAPSSREAAKIYLKLFPDSTQAGYVKFYRNNVRDPENPDTIRFIKELNKRGYNAMIDENDSGGTRKFSDSALLLFNPSEYTSNSKSHKLNKIERAMAVYFS